MAEFCLDCWNQINHTQDNPEKYILSDELELCEECMRWKQVIVAQRKLYSLYQWIRRLSNARPHTPR